MVIGAQVDQETDHPSGQTLPERLRITQMRSGAKNDLEFAKLAGVARSTMSLYLNGKQRPKSSTLHRLAKAAGVDVDWLLGTDQIPPERAPALPSDLALFTPSMLDSPVNFSLLLMSIRACQSFFKDKARPTLREALNWIAGPYALHETVQEMEIKLVPMEGPSS